MFGFQLIELQQLTVRFDFDQLFDLSTRNRQTIVEITQEKDMIVPEGSRWLESAS